MPENTEGTTPKVKKPRLIRKTVIAWFCTLNADQIKAITAAEFLAKVLTVCPEWKMKDDEVKVQAHMAWYKSSYKKLMAAEKVPEEAIA